MILQTRTERLILLTGANGYVGSRLLKALQGGGHSVRCLARNPQKLQGHTSPTTSIVRGDCLDVKSLEAAMEGVEVAYYLIHSMASEESFEELDRKAARIFGTAAEKAGVGQIIYLGGLGRGSDLSRHLKSRQEVGYILRDSGVPTIEFQASIIIGAGSLSFEMIRSLVQRLPVMVTPRWVRVMAQPIYIDDVIDYLVAAIDLPGDENEIFEIGGPERVSYMDIMKEYARQKGLIRLMIPIPVLTPYLSSLWLNLVTPLYAQVGRQLIEGVRNETVVMDSRANEVFAVRPRKLREAMSLAIKAELE
ncbi:MAG: NAD(P)H-binding protein [Planctomycetota bacterium]